MTISPSPFSRLYLTLLQNTILSEDTNGSGGGTRLLELALRVHRATSATSSPSAVNGGICGATSASNLDPMSFYPAFETTWISDPNTDPLVIHIDAWRTGPNEKWRQGGTQAGTMDEHLFAYLQYSDIRICIAEPRVLSDQVGWYDADLVEGMKTGRLGNVLFHRRGGFPDTTNFRRAAVFVVVGSVQFSLHSDSNFHVSRSLKGVEFLPHSQRHSPSIQISSHLSVPSPTPGVPGAETLLKNDLTLESIESHWDSGDLYSLYNAGFVVGAAIEAPFD